MNAALLAEQKVIRAAASRPSYAMVYRRRSLQLYYASPSLSSPLFPSASESLSVPVVRHAYWRRLPFSGYCPPLRCAFPPLFRALPWIMRFNGYQ